MQTYWKQTLVEKDDRLANLLNNDNVSDDPFDAATFLYDLYKTSTVREIDQFKVLLSDLQKDVLEKEMRRSISDKLNPNDD